MVYEKMKEIKYIDLFAGIGGFRIGFENACKKKQISSKCVFSSEIKKHALDVYQENFGNHVIHGDITGINEKEIPDFDVLLAGFPCQAFSSAGKRRGFLDTRGTLFFHIERILREKKPMAFILENVEGLTTHDRIDKKKKIGRTFETILGILEELEYKISYKILNSRDFGLAQDRKRIIIVGTKNKIVNLDNFKKITKNIKDISEKNIEKMDTKFTRLLLSHFPIEELHGKSIKDKRGGPDNIHSWDIGLKGDVSNYQKEILEKLLKERRRKIWAEKKGIPWMDGMPLTLEEIKTFHDRDGLKELLDDLVVKGYVAFENPKNLVKKNIDGKIIEVRAYDLSKEKGYNIITGKLSFEISKILNPNDVSPTIVATDMSKLAIPDDGGLRRITLKEGLRFFGFPDTFKLNTSKNKGYDLLGNTVAVPIVEAVSDRLIDCLELE
jgi:DNA (cytosine-5)-methyltransferase 1